MLTEIRLADPRLKFAISEREMKGRRLLLISSGIAWVLVILWLSFLLYQRIQAH